MIPKTCCPKGLLACLALAIFLSALTLRGQDKAETSAPAAAKPSPADMSDKTVKDFDVLADKALLAMKKRAEELNMKGVAVVAYSEGDTVKSWSSKMVVVGNLTVGPSQKSPAGENMLAIAYTKAAEMAATQKNSGSHVRPLLKGENGWKGGVVTRGKTGLLIVAFSGGPSEDDVKVSRAGLEVLAATL
jgi:hypothetical protein